MSDEINLNTDEEEVVLPQHDNPLRALVDARQSIQRDRVRFGNRISAIERGADKVSPSTLNILETWSSRFAELEKEIDENIRMISDDYPIIEHMTQIKGIGKLLAARLIAMIDIYKDDTVSSLWRYCGFATMNGVSERLKKGERIHYNKNVKPVCYLIGTSFLKSKSPYSDIYYEAREFYQNNRPDWTKMHVHLASMRKMIKIFLSHLWKVWRELESLPTDSPYIIGKDGHSHYIKPENYGW